METSYISRTSGIGTRDKIGYAMGDFASLLVFGLVQSVLQKYYTDVLGIGVVSIMALFPIGANASRDASMETYAANVADEMLQLVKYQLKETDGKTQTQIDNVWNDLLNGSSSKITDDGPDKDSVKNMLTAINTTELDDSSVWKKPIEWTLLGFANDVYFIAAHILFEVYFFQTKYLKE